MIAQGDATAATETWRRLHSSHRNMEPITFVMVTTPTEVFALGSFASVMSIPDALSWLQETLLWP
jgi:hypothetical protein